MHKKWSAIFMVSVLFLSMFTYSGNRASAVAGFSDVPQNKPFASAVYKLAERGIIGGYSDGTFKPGNSITRGQAAAILANLLDLDTENVKDPGFKDVSPGLWSYKSIAAVAEKGIFRGYSDGRFGPNDKITRGQMASTLIKAFGFNYLDFQWQDTPFTDILKLASHQESVYTLYKLGITSGTSKTTYSPNDPITRAQAAVLITKTETVRSAAKTFKASDFGWSEFNSFEDYKDRFEKPEENDEQAIIVLYNKSNNQEYQIVPMKEGKQKLVLRGQKKGTEERDIGYQKFYVTVSKTNGQLQADFEETDDILPTNVRLEVKKDKIAKVSLAAMDGKVIDENYKFETVKQYPDRNIIALLLDQPGEYIATVEFSNGSKVRYGLQAIEESGFYFRTYSIEEVTEATVDLSKYPGNDFSKYEFNEKEAGDIIQIAKSGNTFKIKGLSEGNAYIKFPNNYKKNGIIGIEVRVQKIGSIFKVTPEVSKYESLFY
ncbi:S-layer homology domain-containing protein [Bacillus infantis]|uniref:S-layer homology domain-containing protein n=1 Tax=Bacillus infantis TaxID=324767 RepID=UPI003CEA7D5E